MTGNRYFAEAVHAAGTTHVFFVPTIMLPAMAEMEDMGIRRVVTHGEKAAAYMADGYARASRRPGLCLSQTIGSANLAAGLRDAFMACSPVIALTGGNDAASRYKHVYQEIEDFPMWEQVTKANFQVDTLERFPDLLRQAFRVATSAAPGPVHLELSGTHAQVLEREAELTPLWEERFMKVPAFRPERADAVRAAAQVLAQAARPVIRRGGVIWSGAEAIWRSWPSVPDSVATFRNAKAVLSDDHPLLSACREPTRAGARTVSSPKPTWCSSSGATPAAGLPPTGWSRPYVAGPADIDPEELGRNYPLKAAGRRREGGGAGKLIAAVGSARRGGSARARSESGA
jgi:acetolactate synthase-1/2/3 large subunit